MPSTKKNILAICGSTRKISANLHIIHAIFKLAQKQWNVNVYDGLSDLPYFNQDVTDEQIDPSVKAFRDAIQQADAVLICTPEYVFSLPGILKNALEWTVSTTVFMDKPAALITASSSGKIAHVSLLLVMKTLGIKTEDDMCLLISGVKSTLNAQGEVTNSELITKLENLVKAIQKLLSK